MAQTIDELRKVRLEKLKKLEAQGILGFPAWGGSRMEIGEARKEKVDSTVLCAGRLTALRGHGGLLFADLVDESGKVQLSFKKDILGEKFEILELLDIGDFILVEGKLFKTQSGELTVEVANFEVLTKSIRPLPSSWYGFSDVEERYRQRYVDLLMNPEVKKVFETRSKAVKLLRQKLDRAGFLEVETPVLQPLYGGATAKPFVTHHNALDIDLYLRVSDELYLKRLIVGGFEKVYEIGKDFRNEGIDRQHNPEFTMCEFYWAYANYDDLMKFSEVVISEIIKEITGGYAVEYQGTTYNFTPPWPRVTYRDLILKDTGIDIDMINTEEQLLEEIKKKKVKLDLEGVVGFSALLDTFYKEVSRPKIVGPIFLTDYPVEMKPLAKKKSDDPSKSASFQLLVGGFEWINAYNELNDPMDQRARWEEEMNLGSKGLKEYQVLDEDYIRALEYGMPPTAGWGFGIDRFVSFLTNQHTLKDTILFPTMRPELNNFNVNFSSTNLPDENDMRFIAILRDDIEAGKTMNALGHMTAGLAGGFDKAKKMCFLQYTDKDSEVHPNISHYPFIVLKADNSNQIRKVREEAKKKGIIFTDFTSTMTIGKSQDQIKATKDTPESELDYYGICLFGNTAELKEFTGKFSVYK